jgi:hypothetical protein
LLVLVLVRLVSGVHALIVRDVGGQVRASIVCGKTYYFAFINRTRNRCGWGSVSDAVAGRRELGAGLNLTDGVMGDCALLTLKRAFQAPRAEGPTTNIMGAMARTLFDLGWLTGNRKGTTAAGRLCRLASATGRGGKCIANSIWDLKTFVFSDRSVRVDRR